MKNCPTCQVVKCDVCDVPLTMAHASLHNGKYNVCFSCIENRNPEVKALT